MMLSHLRGKLLIIWIPAFAGMTQFCADELSGFNPAAVTCQTAPLLANR
jgi:hypothetical protein